MLRTVLGAAALSLAALSYGAEPAVDNDRVTAWDISRAAVSQWHRPL